MHNGRLASAIGACASLLLTPVASAGVHAASHHHRTYFAQYTMLADPVYKPKKFVDTGTGEFYVHPAHWSKWTSKVAVGHGTAHADECNPDCPTGHFAKTPVRITLTKPKQFCGRRYFTHEKLVFTARKRPDGLPHKTSEAETPGGNC